MSACTNRVQYPIVPGTCEFGNAEGCDRSCNADSDCKEICGVGCVNSNESFNPKGAEIDCTRPVELCHCVNNLCS